MSTIAEVEAATAKSGFKLSEWIFTTDHKRVGILYLFGSMAAFLVAGLMALGIRIEQTAVGDSGLMNYFVLDFSKSIPTGTAYNVALYFHGAAMILAFLIPGLTGFAANYLVPLMLGARDVAFPRINALSLWLFWAAIVVALLTFLVPDKPDVLWTGYPPYSITTPGNTALYVFTVHLIGFASILGAVNFLVTIIYMRAPGMGWNQMNMFVWTTFAAFMIQIVFVPVLAAAVTLLLFDKYLGTGFFDAARGGDPLLYQNLFWFYSHPAVYVIFLPAMGLLYEIVATQAKNPIFNYKAAVYGGIIGILVITGEVWVHHLYIAGMPDWLRIGMMVTTLLISVPVGLMVISLWGTLYKGAITYNVAMRYVVVCMFLILVGGLTGIPLAITSLNLHLSETSFVHAHFHFIMGLMATYSLFAAIYFWFPKMTGRSADDGIAKLAFWCNVLGTQLTFWPLFIIGVEGMPRRYWDYAMYPQFQPYHKVATIGALITAIGIVLMMAGWIHAAIRGPKTSTNPWKSRSLEWTHTESPPGPGNFPKSVQVGKDWTPYDYHR
ncbi:cytochrome c oxidase subunit I [Bradyrhizobium sp.]|uniref:cytochrome c oxidase subunit I n=1 Tax=Bradyrhizobium sp. TaxID=376 RepID=UPI0040380278